MARRLDKEKAIKLRLQGRSYSEIKETLNISKSTLSNWLHDHPLSKDQVRSLQALGEKRIERYRTTMRLKREKRIDLQHERALKTIGNLSKRDLFISGFFLFWGEGAKGRSGEVSLANTDPGIITSFICWLESLGVNKERMKFTLHLYADMDTEREIRFWATTLKVSEKQFHKPYIKSTNQSNITYKNGFGHGTCNARYFNQELNDYVRMGLRILKDRFV